MRVCVSLDKVLGKGLLIKIYLNKDLKEVGESKLILLTT